MGNIQEKSKKTSSKAAAEEQTEKSLVGDDICEICMEYIPLKKKFYNGCGNNNKKHKVSLTQHHFCTDCIAKYIQVDVIDNNKSKIQCPHPGCMVELDVLSCRSTVLPEVFVRWCDLLCESVIIKKFSRSKMCFCPQCHEMILNECGGTVKKTQCPKCKTLFCFQCMDRSAQCIGKCTRVIDTLRDRNDLLFLETAKQKNWIRCPNCKHCVERTGGCAIIHCRCQARFCYHCRKDVTGTWCCGMWGEQETFRCCDYKGHHRLS